jgi:ABC-type transport system involved in cytochrome c biogenesis permease component
MRWILQKDLRLLWRSPLVVALLVIYPAVIAALVGFAVTSGPDKPRVAFLNQVPASANIVDLGGEEVDVSKESQPLFDAIDAVTVKSRDEAIEKVEDGEVLAALVIPSDITQNLQAAASGSFEPATVEVYYNAEDPAKRDFVENTIKARVQDANAALTKRFTEVAVGYLNLIVSGGVFEIFGQTFDVLGLARSEEILRAARAELPRTQRAALDDVIEFAKLARENLDLSDEVLRSVGTPIRVDRKIVRGGSTPLGNFAAAIAVTVTLMFVALLLAAGALAHEREENAFRRLVRGLVSRTGLLVAKIGLATICAVVVGLLLLLGLGLFVELPWDRAALWLVALVGGAAAFGALGVAMGAVAREVRTASLLAIMASLPLAVIGLVPSGAVSGTLYDLIRIVSSVFPFKPALDALESALGESGGIGGPLLHLLVLTAGFTLAARLALRRFA